LNGHVVEPLVLAYDAFPRMEEVALSATETLRLAFRIFDPTTRLRSTAARGKGLVSWFDLLENRLQEGVTVRLFLADFDPKFAVGLHAGTAAAVEALRPLAAAYPERFAVAPSRHEGDVGLFWRAALWPLVRSTLARDGGGARLWPPARIFPATHHMKVIVADARAMVIGGLDINERRYDDPTHNRPAEETWHDVSLYVEGPAAADADRFLRWLWLKERGRRDRLGRLAEEAAIMVPPLPDARDDPRPPARRPSGDVRFEVTAGVRSRSPFARGPKVVRRTILASLVEIIRSARWYLYIENQFLRDGKIGRVIREQMFEVGGLQLIMLVPAAPDVVAFESDRSTGQRHGEWRQLRVVDGLAQEFSERAGAFTLAGAAMPRSEEVDHDRATVGPRGIVYIHSKVMIADDRVAHVSSANLNGRSLRMDTEAGVAWRGDGVAAFRQRLWAQHLGRPTPTEGDVLTPWRDAAAANLAGRPGPGAPGRFVMPWDREATHDFAGWRPFVPDRYV
jgi:phosphatidylserine/phosphatidylglycerophosphate/cardiolipin synthase-like enzyme